jgi:hypothetical protein
LQSAIGYPAQKIEAIARVDDCSFGRKKMIGDEHSVADHDRNSGNINFCLPAKAKDALLGPSCGVVYTTR